MKSRGAIVAIVTFIAGLYFILDFVVPPTLPIASSQGVVASTAPARLSVRSGNGQTASYVLSGDSTVRPQILVSQRDLLGVAQLVATPLREIHPGAKITVRVGPFAVARSQGNVLTSVDGDHVTVQPGQVIVDPTTAAPVTASPGRQIQIEQRAGAVVSVANGSATLIESGRRVVQPLGGRTELIKVARYGQGAEVQLYEVRPGDTIRIGPATTFADNRDAASQFNTIITTMAFGIGLLSLAGVHGRTLVKRKPGWSLSLFFFVAVVIGVAAGVGKYSDVGTSNRDFSDFIVLRLIASVYSAVFSLLAFYMASAAYRAFRVKTAEAVLMMVSAIIVMLGQTPFGNYLTDWMGDRFNAFWLPNIAAWILRVPNTAVFRGMIFGMMLGAIATAIRYWLSMEKTVSAGD